MKKIVLFLTAITIALITLSELPVKEEFLVYTLSETQYEKLLWFHLQLENDLIKDQKFNAVIFGSSSTLYGFNDSVTNTKTLNLGVNTGHRDLDLYLLERFLEKKNSAKYILREFHSLEPHHMNYYGLHPVIHLFVRPSWLIRNGQNILQPHFLKFLSDRIRAVFQSYFFFHLEKPYDLNHTGYGYRPKLTGIPREDFEKTIKLNEAPSEIHYSKFSTLHHNFKAANRYREKFDQLAKSQNGTKLYYVNFPFLIEEPHSIITLESRISVLESRFNIEVLRIHDDLSFFENKLNFADFGHLSTSGAIKLALQIEGKLK
jgi:hypothetical protein